MMYAANWNEPGYLPVAETEVFLHKADAILYLQDQIDIWCDSQPDIRDYLEPTDTGWETPVMEDGQVYFIHKTGIIEEE